MTVALTARYGKRRVACLRSVKLAIVQAGLAAIATDPPCHDLGRTDVVPPSSPDLGLAEGGRPTGAYVQHPASNPHDINIRTIIAAADHSPFSIDVQL